MWCMCGACVVHAGCLEGTDRMQFRGRSRPGCCKKRPPSRRAPSASHRGGPWDVGAIDTSDFTKNTPRVFRQNLSIGCCKKNARRAPSVSCRGALWPIGAIDASDFMKTYPECSSKTSKEDVAKKKRPPSLEHLMSRGAVTRWVDRRGQTFLSPGSS